MYMLYVGSDRIPGDLMVLQIGPELELMPPLIDTHAVGHKAEHRFTHARGCSDPDQSLASTARQHNDARSCPAVPKHFGHRFLLHAL